MPDPDREALALEAARYAYARAVWPDENPLDAACRAYHAALSSRPATEQGKPHNREDLIAALREAAGIRSDSDAWLMAQAADFLSSRPAGEPSEEAIRAAENCIVPPGMYFVPLVNQLRAAYAIDGVRPVAPGEPGEDVRRSRELIAKGLAWSAGASPLEPSEVERIARLTLQETQREWVWSDGSKRWTETTERIVSRVLSHQGVKP